METHKSIQRSVISGFLGSGKISRLVFIGKDLNTQSLQAGFRSYVKR
jgi:G3E family GTPase